jgi:hypothetical protein
LNSYHTSVSYHTRARAQTFEQIEKYLENIEVEPSPNEPLTFVVTFESDLTKYNLKVIDVLSYLIWYFRTSLETEQTNEIKSQKPQYVA